MPPESIRPFRATFPQSKLHDLRRRVSATQWPDRETVRDDTQGVQLATMQKLAHYWKTEYDWRKMEAKLNGLPQFVTEIDGLDIHFIHVKSKEENALPVIITHGWPGSIIEQLKIIEPLTNPTAHGASVSDAFDVVIPSLPGHGFSGKPTAPVGRLLRSRVRGRHSWGASATQSTLHRVEIGGMRSRSDGSSATWGLLGIHTNMAATVPEKFQKRCRAPSRRL